MVIRVMLCGVCFLVNCEVSLVMVVVLLVLVGFISVIMLFFFSGLIGVIGSLCEISFSIRSWFWCVLVFSGICMVMLWVRLVLNLYLFIRFSVVVCIG